jgi:hypothetical protein
MEGWRFDRYSYIVVDVMMRIAETLDGCSCGVRECTTITWWQQKINRGPQKDE